MTAAVAGSCLPFLPNGRLDVVRLGRNARSDALTSQDEARDLYCEFQVPRNQQLQVLEACCEGLQETQVGPSCFYSGQAAV